MAVARNPVSTLSRGSSSTPENDKKCGTRGLNSLELGGPEWNGLAASRRRVSSSGCWRVKAFQWEARFLRLESRSKDKVPPNVSFEARSEIGERGNPDGKP